MLHQEESKRATDVAKHQTKAGSGKKNMISRLRMKIKDALLLGM